MSTIPAAASLADVRPAEAAAAVAELADAHLIAEHAPGRYAFHDLLRAYAADLARTSDPEELRREAVHRVLDHYLHTACAGTRLLNPLRPQLPVDPPRPGVTPEILTGAADAQAWFAAERHVLLAAIGQAAEAGLDTYAWQLPWAVWLFFDREGYWHDQAAIQHTAIAAAKRLGDRAAQAHVYRDLSATYSRLGLLAEARVYCTQALDLHHELGDRLGEARAHNDIMILAEQQGRLAEALGHAQLALALYREEDNKPGLAKMYNGVGYIHAQLGEYQQALEFCEQALSMSRGRGDPLNEGVDLGQRRLRVVPPGPLRRGDHAHPHRAAHHRGDGRRVLPDDHPGSPGRRLPRGRRPGAGPAGLGTGTGHPGAPAPLGRGPGPGPAARRAARGAR